MNKIAIAIICLCSTVYVQRFQFYNESELLSENRRLINQQQEKIDILESIVTSIVNEKKVNLSMYSLQCTGGDSCCTQDNPCGLGQGDCDINHDCTGGLVCGQDNCNIKEFPSFDSTDDCCMDPSKYLYMNVLKFHVTRVTFH